MTTAWCIGLAVSVVGPPLLLWALTRRRVVTCADCGVQVARDHARLVLLDHGPRIGVSRIWYCDRHGRAWTAVADPGKVYGWPNAVLVDQRTVVERITPQPKEPA